MDLTSRRKPSIELWRWLQTSFWLANTAVLQHVGQMCAAACSLIFPSDMLNGCFARQSRLLALVSPWCLYCFFLFFAYGSVVCRSVPGAAIGQSGPPKMGSAGHTCTGSPSLQDLRSPLLTKWAGPGFSLPPTPDALPMPSASLLACKKKGSS